MSAKKSLELQTALMKTGLVQPLSEKSKGGHLEVLCRQVPGQERGWLMAVDQLLQWEGTMKDSPIPFELHICRRYLRKDEQMVFGWHLAIDCTSSKNLDATIDFVVKTVLEDLKPSLVPSPQPVEPQPGPAPRRAPLAPGQHPAQRSATTRAPGQPGTVVGSPPPDFTPGLRVVTRTRDDNGKETIVEEMPLPHVYREMNKPNAKGKGATLTGGGS